MTTKIAMGIFLFGSLIQDLREKRISYLWLLINALVAIVVSCVCGMEIPDMLLGLIPGGILLLASLVTGDRIGRGDACIVLIMGIYTGLSTCFFSLLLALILSAVFGVVMVILGRFGMKRGVIFTPFLCMGSVLAYCLEYLLS